MQEYCYCHGHYSQSDRRTVCCRGGEALNLERQGPPFQSNFPSWLLCDLGPVTVLF